MERLKKLLDVWEKSAGVPDPDHFFTRRSTSRPATTSAPVRGVVSERWSVERAARFVHGVGLDVGRVAGAAAHLVQYRVGDGVADARAVHAAGPVPDVTPDIIKHAMLREIRLAPCYRREPWHGSAHE